MAETVFDYVIVGGGSAGCVLAGRLSEDPRVSVCLLEAGGPGDGVLIKAPLGFAAGAPLGLNTYRYESVPQPELGGRRAFQPRGKGLGGSSAINAMVYCRGHRSDYDHWASLGNAGWDYASVLPYFKRSENNECGGDPDTRGKGGPLNVCHLQNPSPLNDAFLSACEASGVPRTPDYNGARQEGCWPAQVTQKNGERSSAASAYLTPHLARQNLTIVTRASAARIILTGRRATGVRYRIGRDIHETTARREVLVSAGAFGSPHVLMHSGIGSGADLQRHGITVAHDLPGVGQNLQDHVTSSLTWHSARADSSFGISARGGWRLLRGVSEWRRHRTGPITSNVAESGAFVCTRAGMQAPDIELLLAVAIVDDHNRKMHLGHGYTLHVTLMQPKSRGTIKLGGATADTPPRIDPRYLSHPDDLPVLAEGMRRAYQIMMAAPLSPFRGQMLYPVDPNEVGSIEREIRRSAETEYHPCGTCRMGAASDPMNVVDAELRVHGIGSLRVVDASVMPTITTGHTNAPTIMIAEKAVDLIRSVRL